MQREGPGVKRSTSLSALENAAVPIPTANAAAGLDSCTYSLPYFVPSHPLPPSPVKFERPRKRLKLDCKPPATPEIANLRKLICDYKHKLLNEIKESYTEYRTEQYFLQTGGNITDYYVWKKKPSIQLFNFLRSNPIDSDDEDDKRKAEIVKPVRSDAGAILAQLNRTTAEVGTVFKDAKVTSINTTSLSALPGSYQNVALSPPQRLGHLVQRPSAITSVTETVPSASEVIVERAKQEAQVMQRIAELRKQGLWSAKRLPKVQEPPRSKAHWDYLLEEMQWLAADFAQERKWKRAGCRKIARLVARHFQDKVDAEKKAEKEGELRIRKIASTMAKCMRDFWCNIEKVVQFKQQSRLEEKRRKALDTHLNFIVDQTEKYSNWLTEGLGRSSVGTTSVASSLSGAANDDEFEGRSESDDEETIAKEELDLDEEMRRQEIEELEREGLIPLEDLLRTLPQAVLDKPASISEYESDADESTASKASRVSDEEFAADEGSTDDEATLDEQEAHEKGTGDADDELQRLKTESELPVSRLLEMYSGPHDDPEMPETPFSSQPFESSGDSADDDDQNSEQTQVGIEFLLHPEKPEKVSLSQEDGGPNKEITDIAAAAQSLQPTGYTLETTMVKTPIPMLLKLSLREYQHVGLDWLATMYEKRLNGILADEMGLGKTIQTIALFAHLACEHGVWGPHLIVVPTSVMLNWEMEFKKWCPSFKLLTYYGTPKERKLKRQGWTKTNAFHVCITSYKLVIQDHQSFRRKKWKYLVLDEAQNIKNFKSQRWQTLLNFSSQRRLLLTGTPLQNSLMELWSLMHFLMPNVFSSHNEFKEWFANPLTGMIEGNQEYNESLIRRLHKVLRPFLLRRLKQDVEKQMPKKYEHVVMCRLSKRQRFLYDDFMSQRQTKEVLASGQFLSVINILMQLRKVCNHPDLFDPRPIVSPFQTDGITYNIPSLVLEAVEYNPFKHVSPDVFHPSLASLELELSAYAAHRIRKLQTPRKLIEEIDDQPELQPRPQPTKLRPFVIKTAPVMQQGASSTSMLQRPSSPHIGKTTLMKGVSSTSVQQPRGMAVCTSAGAQITAVPSITGAASTVMPLQIKPLTNIPVSLGATLSQPIALQIQQTQQGSRIMLPSGLPRFLQIVQSGHVSPQAANQQMLPSVSSTPAVASHATTFAVTAPFTSVNGVPVGSIQSPSQVSHLHPSSNTLTKPAVRQYSVGADTTEGMAPLSSAAQLTRGVSSEDTSGRGLKDLALAHLQEKRTNRRKETLLRIAAINKKHCCWKPIYGRDLCEAVSVWKSCSKAMLHGCLPGESFTAESQPGFLSQVGSHWHHTTFLEKCLRSPEMWLEELKEVVERFVFVTPAVVAFRGVVQRAAHYPSSKAIRESERERVIRGDGAPLLTFLHPVQTRMTVQFPEKRLIQYDCGKLQTLDILLRDLKKSGHRVLIFTQMTRMLDVLEAFLNFHGYRYLRLDGTTRVENRQLLMDRFNLDTKIFCFILSTRSGGIGVNLTGADTVIFYDSDWNPTMDAQAQDRCHRIGQTRDVHIYRLVSEKTVEENILKKSNQKKMLGDVAIEGGNFTTAFFKEQTIKELFEEPSGLRAMADQVQAFEQAKALLVASTKPMSDGSGDSAITQSQLEQALCNVEDEPDIQAAIVARAEQSAELAEFDENIPWDEKEADQKKKDEENLGSKVEEEIASIERELKPVERYAVRFLEETEEQFSSDAMKVAEEDIETAKQEWELARLKALREEEERKAELEEDEVLFTYSRDDSFQVKKQRKRRKTATAIVFKDVLTDEEMSVWGPPTPPSSDSDIYMDHSLNFLYETSVMPESMLPPIYTKREKRRIKQDTSGRKRMRFDEVPRVPRSLFDRPNATLLKMRRDLKAQKQGGSAGIITQRSVGGCGVYSGSISATQQTVVAASAASGSYTGMKPPMPLIGGRPAIADVPHDQPEWLIHEDWALLQAVQTLLQMPLNLTVVSPAHIANWDLVADTVNAISRIYRSPKQCKMRYENIIIPREEGRILYDITPRKPAKKGKGIYKTRNNRPMKTGQLYMQDHGSSVTTLHAFRFDCIKNISARRVPTLRPTLVHPMIRNPKHTAVLTDNGINYDQPLTPVQVAAIRQERIMKEKKQQQSQAVAGAATTGSSGAPTAVSAVPTAAVAPLPMGSGSLATIATPISAAPIEQQQQIQLLTSRGLAMSAIPQALTTGLVQQRGASAILPVVPGMTLAQSGITPQQLQSVASLNIAASSSTVANVMAAASLQKQTSQSVSIARSLSSTGSSIVVNTAGGSMSPAAAINKRGMPQVPTNAVAAVVAAAAAAPVQAAAGVAASPGAAATLAALPRGSRPLPLSVGDLAAAGLRMAAAPTATQIRQLQGVTASTVVPTGAATTAVTVQQQVPPSRLLQQPQQQLMQVKAPQVIKQRSAVSNPVGPLTQRLPGSTQLTQASQQLTQIQQSSAVSVATLVKSVTTGSLTSSVTIPVTAVSVGGVNINVSLPHQQKVAVANQALVKASSVSPPVSGQQPTTRQLQIQQVTKQKPTQTPQLTQKVALTTQMQQVGKLPMALPSGQVQVVPSKVNTSIAQLQQIMQHQHKQLHITGVQQTSSPTIIAMHSVPPTPVGQAVTKVSASGVAAASLGTVSMASARQIPMQTTLTIMPTASATSLVAPSTVQSSSSSTSSSQPSSSPSQ